MNPAQAQPPKQTEMPPRVFVMRYELEEDNDSFIARLKRTAGDLEIEYISADEVAELVVRAEGAEAALCLASDRMVAAELEVKRVPELVAKARAEVWKEAARRLQTDPTCPAECFTNEFLLEAEKGSAK